MWLPLPLLLRRARAAVAQHRLQHTNIRTHTQTHTHTHTHTSHTTSNTAHTTFVLINLHHLLCLSFLPRPASTFVSDYWKKLTCGVIRSFPFVNVNLHKNSLVLGFPIPRKNIWTKNIGKPTRCQPNWRLGNQKSAILWWIVLTVFGFTVFLDQSSQCSDDHCGHLTIDSYTDLYRVLEQDTGYHMFMTTSPHSTHAEGHEFLSSKAVMLLPYLPSRNHSSSSWRGPRRKW